MANYYENLAPTPEAYDKANEYWEKRIELDPKSAEAWLAQGVNRWSRSYRFQNLPSEERLKAAQQSLRSLQKAMELDPNYPEPYSWLSVLYKSVLTKLEPDKEARYNAEADRYIEKFQDMRKRAAEKKKLEEELKKTG
jgi:tetratricopeptide (TPR) repeat protein